VLIEATLPDQGAEEFTGRISWNFRESEFLRLSELTRAFFQRGDYKGAGEAADKAVSFSDCAEMRKLRSDAWTLRNEREKSESFRENIQKRKQDVENTSFLFRDTANKLARYFATTPNKEFSNGKEAIKYAKIALSADFQEWFYFGTMAAVLARDNQFEEAVKVQSPAIERMKKERVSQDRIETAETHLQLYRKGHPFTEEKDSFY